MVYIHAKACATCQAKGLVGAEACGECHGIGYLPVNKQTLSDMALTLTRDLPGEKWDRNTPNDVDVMLIVTRLQAIENEYYRLKGNSFPV